MKLFLTVSMVLLLASCIKTKPVSDVTADDAKSSTQSIDRLSESTPNSTRAETAAPRMSQNRSIKLKDGLDLFYFAGLDVDMPGKEHNQAIKDLLTIWKTKGLWSGRSLYDREEVKSFVEKFGNNFDFSEIMKLEVKSDGQLSTLLLENGNYSIELEHIGLGDRFSVQSITVFTPEDSLFEGIRIGDSIQGVKDKYGDFNFEDDESTGQPWKVYVNSDGQSLGLHFVENRVDIFQLQLNSYR